MKLIIEKLFDKYDYEIEFKNKINVLIGENGAGKSTILNIIHYIKNEDYESLSKIKFKKIILKDEEEIVIYYDDYKRLDFTYIPGYIFYLKDFLSNNDFVYESVSEMITAFEDYIYSNRAKFNFSNSKSCNIFYDLVVLFEANNPGYSEKDLNPKQIPYGSKNFFENIFIILSTLKKKHNFVNLKEILSSCKFSVDYTQIQYRMIKDDQYYVFSLEQSDETSTLYNYVKYKESTKYKIRYYSDDVLKELNDKIFNMIQDKTWTWSEEYCKNDIDKIKYLSYSLLYKHKRKLYKIGTDKNYEEILNFIKHPIADKEEKYLSYDSCIGYEEANKFLLKNFDSLISNINDERYVIFKEMANTLFKNKDINVLYKSDNQYDFMIIDKTINKRLRLNDLSSGEYKMIRLIMMIAFSTEEQVLLIDEPELSLSSFWQSTLIDFIEKYCIAKKIIIATQSPNIVNENQFKYVFQIKKEL